MRLVAGLKRIPARLSTADQPFDGWLLFAALSLMLIGWVMVTSARSGST